MAYDIKDLFINMLQYCDNSVTETKHNNETTITKVNDTVKAEKDIRYSQDRLLMQALNQKARIVRTSHSVNLGTINANASKSGDTSALSCVDSSKTELGNFNPIGVVQYVIESGANANDLGADPDIVPSRLRLVDANVKANKSTVKLRYSVKNTGSQAQNCKLTVYIIWQQTKTLSKHDNKGVIS